MLGVCVVEGEEKHYPARIHQLGYMLYLQMLLLWENSWLKYQKNHIIMVKDIQALLTLDLKAKPQIVNKAHWCLTLQRTGMDLNNLGMKSTVHWRTYLLSSLMS